MIAHPLGQKENSLLLCATRNFRLRDNIDFFEIILADIARN
jgi:hypothetical protein